MRPGREWFARSSLEVAEGLLGAVLRVWRPDGAVAVRITEVEAYAGARDPGSHAFRGRTRRNAVMFGPPGHLYVYRHLGLHHCVNVVTGPAGEASAVLLRAGEVVDGAAVAHARRSASGVVRSPVDLARGPARLAVALGLGLADDGADLLAHGAADARAELELSVPDAPSGPSGIVSRGPRVGVAGPGGDAETYPWRFWSTADPTVSTYRPAAPRRRATPGPDTGTAAPRGTAH